MRSPIQSTGCRAAASPPVVPARRERRGVLLLVVLSMLTLFMLLGVTYLVLAARTRATSRAFLKLEDDFTANAIKVKPLLREAALQLIRGTANSRSAIRFHDLLGDKYAASDRATIQAAALVATGDVVNAIGPSGQLLRLHVGSGADPAWTGCVLTFLDGPSGVKLTSARIAEAATLTVGGTPYGFIWVPRPAGLVGATVPAMQAELAQLAGKQVLINSRDFAGIGFTRAAVVTGAGNTLLNDGGLAPNRSLSFSTNFDSAAITNAGLDGNSPNEDYDAPDEQNMALARADQTVQSFVRPWLFDAWLRDYARRSGTTYNSQPQAEQDLWNAMVTRKVGVGLTAPSGGDQAQAIALHQLRRASNRPFPFDHYQNDGSSSDRDFAGRSLGSLATALFPTASGRPLGDVDNDGDGIRESVWLDLGMGVTELGDGKRVKPLFAIHCIDLGGRVSLNAHGSPTHAAEQNMQNILGHVNFAPWREEDTATGTITLKPPTRLRGGLGYGPGDVRLDAVLGQSGQAAVMFGLANPSSKGFGVQRDIPAVVGRYGDGIGNGAAPALPGVPGRNDRRMSPDRRTWTDRGLPLSWTRRLTDPNGDYGLFAGGPPDTWSRLAVGVDHRGQPFYVSRTTMPTTPTTDNVYELDLYRARQSNPYVQAISGNDEIGYVDQPFAATDLEALLRPYDADVAMATSPRLLALAMATAGNQATLARWRQSLTTDLWDTPAVVGPPVPSGKFYDPDLVLGLKMDLNRPFGDALDNDGDTLVDEPGETGDTYGGTFTTLSGTTAWILARGPLPLGTDPNDMPTQPGADEPHLRARQLYAFQLYNLLKHVRDTFQAGAGGLRLFAVTRDTAAGGTPVAADKGLNSAPNAGNAAEQANANERGLAQWAVNVVDFMDPDAIMTPFRFKQPTSTPPANEFVVWGCEQPDVMITETLAFHDRRTADTKGDPTGETTGDFRQQYATVHAAWTADPTQPKPDPNDPDNNADADDPDFDQVRIPEGSLFLELHGLRNPNLPNLPQELYSVDPATGGWYLDIGRVPAGGTDPVWRMAITKPRAADPANDVFKRLADHPDTTPLTSGTSRDKVADLFPIDRYVWLSATAPPATVNVTSGTAPTLDNTFYRRDGLSAPKLKPGGYLVVGPRRVTAVGSIDNSTAASGQKWGVPSKQRIELDATGSTMPVLVTDLKEGSNPGVSPADVTGAQFGNSVPPASLPETTATWVSLAPPAAWSANANVAPGLSVSEPLRNAYYPEPTVTNPASGLKDAYGPLDSENHTSFLRTPLDQSGTPLSDNLLSGGSYANYCTVFVERLADPTRPHEPDAMSPNWNPYVVVDFMPVDLTVFNGESTAADPSETQGPDRSFAELPLRGTPPPATPLEPAKVPLPFASSAVLTRRHTYFHSRQRGFGTDLPDYDNDRTLFGVVADPANPAIKRNPHPFKQVGSLDDLKDTPTTRSGAVPTAKNQRILPGGYPTTERPLADLAAAEKACFRHELGQAPAGRKNQAPPPDWNGVPYQSLGWVNSSFGRRLEAGENIGGGNSLPAAYAGVPDRPLPWLAWNDRPFTNPAELALVPMTSPGRLLSNYRNLDHPGGLGYVTGTSGTTSSYNSGDFFGACTAGAHLLPLTPLTDGIPPTAGGGPPLTRRRNADVLGGLFEYVRVRSPFTGSEIVLSGTAVAGDGRPDRFVGPFNRVSRYRDPGRPNVNTIPRDATVGPPIWHALLGVESGTSTPLYEEIVSSGTIPLSVTAPGGTATGVFSRPFRPFRKTSDSFEPDGFASNTLFPQSLLRNPPTTDPGRWYVADTTITPPIDDRFTPRSFTLLRDGPVVSGTTQPLFAADKPDAWANDPNRNAWFRFNALARALANTTHRSEGYAVWVTMGLFEVEAVREGPSNPDAYLWDPDGAIKRYPDGYRLVREYGSDTGDVTRHRGFYILDRSIPVGYERGKDHNVDDCIVIERFLE
jgi:hypothetical protein